jgi:hypothetical protein
MRHHSGQNFVIQEILIGDIQVLDHGPLPPSEQSEFDCAVAAVKRARRRRGPVVVQSRQDGVQLIAGRFQYILAQSVGAAKVRCAVFEKEVPNLLSELIEVFHSKLSNPIEIADLIAALIDADQFNQTQLGKLLGATKSTICQLYSLNALPQDVKSDCHTDPTVNRSELVRIAQLAADKQSEDYWNTKRLISDRSLNHEDETHHEVKELCELMLRVANKATRFLVKRASARNCLGAPQKAELYAGIKALSDAMFSLKAFIEMNLFKKILRSLFRNIV